VGVNSQKEFIYTSNCNLDLRGSRKKQSQRLRFYVKTQFGKNQGEEGENSVFSDDYNVFY